MRTIPQSAHVTYSRQFRRCGKPNCARCGEGPGHGPYWFAVWREDGRVRRRYLGVDAPAGMLEGGLPAGTGTLTAPIAGQTATSTALRVRTLGSFAVHSGGRLIPAHSWRARRAGGLFKVLLGASGFTLPREQAEELLWPEADGDAARHNLHNALYTLRRLLGSASRSVVSLDGDVLRLLPPADPHWLDALDFEHAAHRALAAHDPQQCRDALALYLGEYLPDDPYEEWALTRRGMLGDLRLALLLHLSALSGAVGGLTEAEHCLRQALLQDPSHEDATAQLMTLLIASGRRADALRAYNDLATALDHDLGVAPSADLAALRAQVLTQQVAPTAAGQQPPATAPARRTNLILPLTSFVGRTRDREDVLQLLSRARLVTLTGAGGCGKTRLAVQVADSLVDAYPDGVWLIPLDATPAGGDSSVRVARAIATALGVQEERGRAMSATLAAFLAPRSLLLLVDNCEHLSTACASLAAALLSAASRLRILATSRERLGVPGEVLHHVASLAVPSPAAPVNALTSYDAVALFVDRARSVSTLDMSSPAVTPVVAQICRRLDGIPLAIELAAARVSTLPLQTLAARLDDCLGVLAGGPRVTLPRQRTLRATIDWSYALLSDRERAVLRRLAAFSGGWTIDASQKVCELGGSSVHEERPAAPYRDDFVEAVSSLVGKSLVQMHGYGGETRYALLEPVRQYAAEALQAAAEVRQVRDRHLAWCVELAESAQPALWGGPERDAWMNRLESEHDNCRSALRWSVDRRNLESGLRLACALRRFWDVRGYGREGLEWLDALLEHAVSAEVAPAIRAGALVDSAVLAYGLNNYSHAARRAKRGLALCKTLGGLEGMADALNVLGMIASDKEDLDSASERYSEALVLYRQLGNQRRIAAMLCNLGNVAYFRAEYRRAVEMYCDAREVFLASGEVVSLAMTLSNMGAALRELGDMDRATQTLELSAEYARQAGAASELAHALNNLGDVAFRSGQYARSLDLMGRSAELFFQSGDTRNVLVSLVVSAEALSALGQMERVARLCGVVTEQCHALEIPAVGSEWTGLARAAEASLAALGDGGYARARREGSRLALEQAIALGSAHAAPRAEP